MHKQEKVLRRVRSALQNALDTSPDPRDYYIEIAKPQARGLLRRIDNALKPHPLSRKQWIEARTAV